VCIVRHNGSVIRGFGPVCPAPLLQPIQPAVVELRHPARLLGHFLSVKVLLDSGSAGDFLHPEILSQLFDASVLTHRDLHEFAPSHGFGAATGDGIRSNHYVTLDVLTGDNAYASIEFLITDDITSDLVIIGSKGLDLLGYMFKFNVTRPDNLPRPPHYDPHLAIVGSITDLENIAKFPIPDDLDTADDIMDTPDLLPDDPRQVSGHTVPGRLPCFDGVPGLVGSPLASASAPDGTEDPVFPIDDKKPIISRSGYKFCSYAVIVDLQAKRPAVDVCTSLVVEHPTDEVGRVRLEVRCPSIETANPPPLRNAKPSTSGNKSIIRYMVLEDMVSKDYIEYAPYSECHYLEHVVLVDKSPQLPPVDPMTTPRDAILKRYRLTLACKKANSMMPVVDADNNVRYMIPALVHEVEKARTFQTQYQTSGYESLTKMRGPCLRWKGKVDVTNGYQSILMHVLMRRFFCTQAQDPLTQSKRCFRWKTWPQGYYYSSIAFQNAMSHVLEKFFTEDKILVVLVVSSATDTPTTGTVYL
jgi:hypothetical protein